MCSRKNDPWRKGSLLVYDCNLLHLVFRVLDPDDFSGLRRFFGIRRKHLPDLGSAFFCPPKGGSGYITPINIHFELGTLELHLRPARINDLEPANTLQGMGFQDYNGNLSLQTQSKFKKEQEKHPELENQSVSDTIFYLRKPYITCNPTKMH